jgi:hypothetical protein
MLSTGLLIREFEGRKMTANIMDKEEIRQKKTSFWFFWTFANAIGIAIGWPAGEAIGQWVTGAFGWHVGLLTAALIFETSVWFWRLLVTTRFREFETLKVIDKILWIVAEVFLWFITEAFYSPGQPLTFGVIFMTTLSAGSWITMASTRLAGRMQPSPGRWWVNAFILTFLGFIGGSTLITFIIGASMLVGEFFSKFSLILSWAMSGAVLGLFIGAVTGLPLIKMITWAGPVHSEKL